MRDEEKLFTNIVFWGKKLKDCELVYECKRKQHRLYVIKADNAFYACAVEFITCDCNGIKDDWKNDSLLVLTLFEAVAYYDGVRHFEFNRNGGSMDGYLYYPDMDVLIDMLKIIRELELTICRDAT